jgi:CelD/BcsL family acetyltransferase involved in cellulose biosynthesis
MSVHVDVDQRGHSQDAGPAGLGYRTTSEAILDEGATLELWADAATASVFNHPAWWLAAIEAFGKGRRLVVSRVRYGDTTVALWPFWIKRLGLKEAMARVIEPVGARVTDYCMPLLHREHNTPEVLKLLLQQAIRQLDVQSILLLPKVPAAAEHAATLAAFAARHGLLLQSYGRSCPAMALPATYDELELRWSNSHRGDVRRQIRRLRRAGTLKLVTARSRPELEEFLPRLCAMHAENWQARTGFSDLRSGPMAAFLATLAARLPLEMIAASELRLNSVAIAMHFGFRERNSLLWYKPTFSFAWANYAPGKVHVALAAQNAIATGLDKFDFIQGNEPFKRQWSDLTTVTKSFALARPIAYPMWAWTTRVRKFAAEYRI